MHKMSALFREDLKIYQISVSNQVDANTIPCISRDEPTDFHMLLDRALVTQDKFACTGRFVREAGHYFRDRASQAAARMRREYAVEARAKWNASAVRNTPAERFLYSSCLDRIWQAH